MTSFSSSPQASACSIPCTPPSSWHPRRCRKGFSSIWPGPLGNALTSPAPHALHPPRTEFLVRNRIDRLGCSGVSRVGASERAGSARPNPEAVHNRRSPAMMRKCLLTLSLFLIVIVPVLLGAGSARAADEVFKATTAITLPNGQAVRSFDISFVDPVIGRYLLA